MEVAAVLRRALLSRKSSEDRAVKAQRDYVDLPLTRHGHTTRLPRMLGLRDNFSACDAPYVALAESMGAHLVTADGVPGRADRKHTGIEVASLEELG